MAAVGEIKIDILELKGSFVKFVLSGVDVSIANALRRVMIAEVPTLAVDIVEVETNTSCLHDDFLAHRIGLVPLKYAKGSLSKDIKYQRECVCAKQCPDCTIELVLHEKCTANEEGRAMGVTSQHLKDDTGRVVAAHEPHENVLLAHQDAAICLAKLRAGQEIKLKAMAIKGTGQEHTKWSPVATAVYAFDPVVQLNADKAKSLTADQKEAFVKSCPAKVYKLNDRTQDIEVAHQNLCMFCEECVKVGETFKDHSLDDNVVTISQKPNTFIFSVETVGSLAPGEVVLEALRVLSDKIQDFHDEIYTIATEISEMG